MRVVGLNTPLFYACAIKRNWKNQEGRDRREGGAEEGGRGKEEERWESCLPFLPSPYF